MRHLPDLLIEALVRQALLEDLGRAGDLTTDAIVPSDARATAALVA
ncbi:MAG: carboxylating nicotinate-nucleotide diphosphorylase, partial [Georgenia sp.]